MGDDPGWQTLLGISSKVHTVQSKLSKTEGNKLSVRQELQADCLAGVWANHANSTRKLLEAVDIALRMSQQEPEKRLAELSNLGDAKRLMVQEK